MPKVSVSIIIPTYNYGRFILDAIDSVVTQDIETCEVLIVDDGSTDETARIVASVPDERIRYLALPHRGVSAARNVGIRAARGEYIAFLDADDRWKPGKLRRQLDILQHHADVATVFTNFVRFTDDGLVMADQFSFYNEISLLRTSPTYNGDGQIVMEPAFEAFVRFTDVPAFTQTMIFRRGVFGDLRGTGRRIPPIFFDERLAVLEDTQFCLQAFRRGRVAFISTPLVEVRRHGTNVTSNWREATSSWKLKAFQSVPRSDLTPSERRALRRRIGREWTNVGRHHARRGRLLAALRAYWQALLHGFWRSAVFRILLLVPQSVGLRRRV